MRLLKIAMVSHYLPSGSKIGAGYQAHYMANALVRRGHHVTVFSPCRRPEEALYDAVEVEVGGRLRTFRLAWNLRKINFASFDVLHAHGDDYWLWGPGFCKPPHVRTMHGSCFAEAANVPRVKEKLRMLLLGASEALATLVADRTVCVSRNTRHYYPWVKDVIFNGVDAAAFHPGGERERNPTILFVGTYQNRKRGKLLMEAFCNAVLPALPSARLWMVCSDAPAAPGVSVLGRVPLEQLAELYRRAWLFCLPSSYEGFGVPYIEAMASGTPVVATPNPGACEVLADGQFGVIAQPEQLGAALLELLKDPAERTKLEVAGLRRSADYVWERIVREYELVYDQMTAGQKYRQPSRITHPSSESS